jgi:demethylmenaquinone methyltransferase/2-methoxy-6-polyprenyl-1,4-benzoquinol methylase
MANSVKPYKNSNLGKKQQVAQMFDNISPGYDKLNRIISFGSDVAWRKKVVALVREKNAKDILDIATGTGDLAIMLAEIPQSKIIGLDISAGMLEIGRQKIVAKTLHNQISMQLGDSEHMTFADHTFDAVTVSFGIRNFENLERGLAEILRVMRPGALFVILETSVPQHFVYRKGYQFYSKFILPLIGRMFSKDTSAYDYLGKSAAKFPYGEALHNILTEIGFTNVVYKPQTFGVATIYSAYKPS